MISLMVFRGGPKDGEESEPHEGWPAPTGGLWPDEEGNMHSYLRTVVEETDEAVRHVYEYRGIDDE